MHAKKILTVIGLMFILVTLLAFPQLAMNGSNSNGSTTNFSAIVNATGNVDSNSTENASQENKTNQTLLTNLNLTDSANNSGMANLTGQSNQTSNTAVNQTTAANESPNDAVVFKVNANSPPAVDSLVLNSSSGANLTTENLTAYTTTSDADNDSVKVIYDWKKNGSSIAVLNMPFEGGSTSAFTKDYSDYGNNGTVNGAIYSSTGGYDGKGAYTFDGVDDNITITGYKGITGTNPRSVTAWIKTGESINSIVGWGLNSAGQKYTFRTDLAGGGIRIEVNGGYVIGTTDVTDNNWHFVALTWENDGTPDVLDSKLYVDGALETVSNSLDEPINTASGVDVRIADDFNANREFNGTIDEIRIYDRALSSEQISALYNNKTDLIVSQETAYDEVWSVTATPNDGIEDGTSVAGNNLTIESLSLLLNSSSGTNSTSENLTVYPSAVGDEKLIYDWKKDGSSIAVLNMPFEGGSNSVFTKDYSSYGNNGTVNGATWNSASGYDGKGAYEFDGVDDFINVSDATWNSGGKVSVIFWNYVAAGDVIINSIKIISSFSIITSR